MHCLPHIDIYLRALSAFLLYVQAEIDRCCPHSPEVIFSHDVNSIRSQKVSVSKYVYEIKVVFQ